MLRSVLSKVWQKRPTTAENGTYYSGKRDLFGVFFLLRKLLEAKRDLLQGPKETSYRGKRDLFWCKLLEACGDAALCAPVRRN
jgi:hypothetical protein